MEHGNLSFRRCNLPKKRTKQARSYVGSGLQAGEVQAADL